MPRGRPKKSDDNFAILNLTQKAIKPKKITPVKAIREKCIDCCAGQMAEVRECKMEDCSLWGFRMGKNPNRTGKGGRKEWKK